MFCTNCGRQLADGTAFCPQCGTPATAPAAAAAPEPQAVVPVAQPAAVQPVQQMQPMQPVQQVQPNQQATYQQPTYQQPGNGQQQQVGAVPSNPTVRGCFGSGWDDVKGSAGWFKKVALMALIDMVPIFGFVSVGYGWSWGKDVALGKREDMPDNIVNGDNFKLGFFIFVLGIVFAFALGFVGALFGFIPIIGILAALVLGVFAGMFINLAYLRTALFNRIGAGFELGKVFEGFKRNLGTLFCISFVPTLVAVGFGMIIGFAFALFAGTIVGVDFLAVMSSSARYGSYSHVPASLVYGLGGSGVILFILLTIAVYLEMIAYQFCQLVTQRAMGHYVARIVPEWALEATGVAQVAPPTAQAVPAASSAPAASSVPSAPGAFGQQPAAGFSAAAAPAAPAPAAAVAEAPVVAAAPLAGAAAVGAAVAAVDDAAAAPVKSQPVPEYDESLDSYAFSETSVLPELPDEDLDTIVQPELMVHDEAFAEGQAAVSQAVPAESQDTPPDADGAVRLQPTPASGELMGDDSDTLVLMEEAKATSAPASASGQRTLQLTRANGDTCVLSSFPVTIGKGSEADLVIEGNGAISRVHMRILRDGDVFAAEDLGSTNKTFIGTYELPPNTPTILSDGDELKLANEVLRIKVV